MMDWYFLLAPVAVLAVLLLFRFVGCDRLFALDELPPPAPLPNPEPPGYPAIVYSDKPVMFLRLQEISIAVAAKNEMGTPDGSYDVSPDPLLAGDPAWLSTDAPTPQLDLNVNEEPRLLDNLPGEVAIRVNGGWINWPSTAGPNVLNTLTEFTLELLVMPEWNLLDLGRYYCLMEVSSGADPNAGTGKNAGFAIYAGPGSDPMSPYSWQLWVGTGPGGFQRLPEVMPYLNPDNNPGPTLGAEPTYLAITFSQSQSQAVLYVYYGSRDVSHTTYPLTVLPYTPAQNSLLLGMASNGPLFPPFNYDGILYPFKGRIAEVAIYDKALTETQVLSHGMNAFG